MQKHFGCVRWVYNWALNRKKKSYEETGKSPSLYSLCNELTLLRHLEGTEWLSDINRKALEASLQNLESAYRVFFRDKKGFPVFKSKRRDKKSFTIRGDVRVKFGVNILTTENFREGVKCIFHRTFEGKIKRATYSQDASGKYFVSLLVETTANKIEPQQPSKKKSIGIDVGIKHFATLSTGETIANPRHLKNSLKRLKRLQRRLSRKVKGSNNRLKAKQKLAVQYERVTNQRKDFLHQTTAKLIRENQAGTLCLETLNVKGMIQNHKLAQALSDVSIGTFNEFLKYKADWYGVSILRCDAFFPSSKTCNNCGSINSDLKLHHREWTCSDCGHSHDRDINAALNIRDYCFPVGKEFPEFTPVETEVTRSLKQEIACNNSPCNH